MTAPSKDKGPSRPQRRRVPGLGTVLFRRGKRRDYRKRAVAPPEAGAECAEVVEGAASLATTGVAGQDRSLALADALVAGGLPGCEQLARLTDGARSPDGAITNSAEDCQPPRDYSVSGDTAEADAGAKRIRRRRRYRPGSLISTWLPRKTGAWINPQANE